MDVAILLIADAFTLVLASFVLAYFLIKDLINRN